MHATKQVNLNAFLLRERPDPKGYILYDSVHMALWKRQNYRNGKYIHVPCWVSGVGKGGMANYKADKQLTFKVKNCPLQCWGGKYMTLCICQNTMELYITKGEL